MSECFICRCPEASESFSSLSTLEYYTYLCPVCGTYAVSDHVKRGFPQNFKAEFLWKAPSIGAARKLKNQDGYLLVYDEDTHKWQGNECFYPVGIEAFCKEYPQDAIDIFNSVLANLGRLIRHPTDRYELVYRNETVPYFAIAEYSYFYSKNYNNAVEMCKELEGIGWLRIENETTQGCDIAITPKGWLTLRELKPSENSDRAFLAMWFSKEDKQLGMLRNAVREAVNQAGYICDVVDEIHHNDYIMDKVLNLIKDSRFVIADFTFAKEGDTDANGKIFGGVRGGVYYEAGFAKGLGRPVIVSCRKDKDSEARIHFDIAQLSTIFWKQDGDKLTTNGLDFVEFMKERIIATVGKGKYYKKQ